MESWSSGKWTFGFTCCVARSFYLPDIRRYGKPQPCLYLTLALFSTVSPNPRLHYLRPQVFAWWLGCEAPVPRRVPFVVDVSEGTFVHLERLMERASPSAAAAARPPAQEDECMMVAALRLLTLQVRGGEGLHRVPIMLGTVSHAGG